MPWNVKPGKSESVRGLGVVKADTKGLMTQDLYFWQDAFKKGHKACVDCSVRVGHYSVKDDIVW